MPGGAEKTLKVLHELHVYQVELDLQQDQLETETYALEEDLVHYQSLFNNAPLAYFVINSVGIIINANSTAATLFGRNQHTFSGLSMTSLLATKNRTTFFELLSKLHAGSKRELCKAELCTSELCKTELRKSELRNTKLCTTELSNLELCENISATLQSIRVQIAATAAPDGESFFITMMELSD